MNVLRKMQRCQSCLCLPQRYEHHGERDAYLRMLRIRATTNNLVSVKMNHNDGENETWESSDHARDRTAIAWDVYVEIKEVDSTSKTKICPDSVARATREPSGLWSAQKKKNWLATCRDRRGPAEESERRGRYIRTCLHCMPNLFRPLVSVARRSPKLSSSAEWMVTLPEPPVEA
jgi:hypothetical protein